MEYRTVHDEGRNRRFRGLHGNGRRSGRTLQDVGGVERFGPLRERPFRLLCFGRTGSSVGDSLIPVALTFAVLGSAARVGARHRPRLLRTAAAGFTARRRRLGRPAAAAGSDDLGRSPPLRDAGDDSRPAARGTAHVWQLAALQFIGRRRRRASSTRHRPRSFRRPSGRAACSRRTRCSRCPQSATSVFGPAALGADRRRRRPGLGVRDRRGELPRQRALRRGDAGRRVRAAPRSASGTTSPTAGARSAATAGSPPASSATRSATSGSGCTSCSARSSRIDHLGGAPAVGLDRRRSRGRRHARRARRLPDPAQRTRSRRPSRSGRCAQLPPFALVRPFPLPAVMAAAAIFGGCGPRRQRPLGDGDAAGSATRPARAGRVDRPAALARPHAGGPGARRPLSDRARRARDPRPRRDADVRAEPPRARVRAARCGACGAGTSAEPAPALSAL